MLPCLSLRKLDFCHSTTPLKRGGGGGGSGNNCILSSYWFCIVLCSYCSFDLSIGKEILILQRECHARRLGESCLTCRVMTHNYSYDVTKGPSCHPLALICWFATKSHMRVYIVSSFSDVLLRVLLVVQQLLQENRHGSKRDIYYMHPSVFQGESRFCFSIHFLSGFFENFTRPQLIGTQGSIWFG